jgi:hypothetical protein
MFIAPMFVREDFTVIVNGILARALEFPLISNAALLLDGDGPFLINILPFVEPDVSLKKK